MFPSGTIFITGMSVIKNQRIKKYICLYGNRSRYEIVATAIKSRTVSQNETFASDVEKGTT
jgi:hypothetical protein